MSEWLDTTIGTQLTLQRGIDITKSTQRVGPVPVISSGGVSSFHDTPSAHGPGVVLGRKGVVGSVYFVESDYWPHDTTLWVKDFKGNHPRFVYFFFRWMAPRIATMDVGSANPTLNRNHVHPIQIRWPSSRLEQEAIASILGALDDKIALNQKMNETMERLVRAVFDDWFVSFGPIVAKRDGAAAYLPPETWGIFPDSFNNDGVPNGWQLVALDAILDEIETGGRPKGGVAAYSSGVPSVGAESIVALGHFDYTKTKYIPEAFFSRMKKGHVRNRDVLLYKDGGRPGEFEPHLTLVGDGFPFDVFAINEHVYRLRATPSVGQAYLYFSLSSALVMEEMRVKGTGVAIPGLNSTQVKSLTTLVPSPSALSAFDSFADPLISRILSNCNEARILARTRDLLLPQLMTGALRTAEAEVIVEAVL